MADFTKGPWVVNKYGSIGAGKFGCKPIIAQTDRLFGCDAEFGSHEANAHLIAAAPDLYDALQMMLHDPDASENTDFARRVLAKAEGKT